MKLRHKFNLFMSGFAAAVALFAAAIGMIGVALFLCVVTGLEWALASLGIEEIKENE